MPSMDSYESWSSHIAASAAELENILYNHLQECRKQEHPDQVLARFRQLFIEADYPEPLIWQALVELAMRPSAEREFKYTLNRCSYTLINAWSTQPRNTWAVSALVQLFETIPPAHQEVAIQVDDLERRLRQILNADTDDFIALSTLMGRDIRSDYAGSNLSGVDFEGKNLEGVDFSRCNLHRANLRRAVLRKANLSGAYLYQADLRDADLREANLTGADLEAANLQNANLEGSFRDKDTLELNIQQPVQGESTSEEITNSRSNKLSNETYRIRQLSRHFIQTEQYAALRRFANLVSSELNDGEQLVEDQLIANQLKQYPFLYDHSLLTKDSDLSQKNQVRRLRQDTEAKIGIQLARYCNQRNRGHNLIISNPTRLPNAELQEALRYYTGKVEGNRSHRDLAQMFSTYSKTVRSFRDFKEEFLEFLLRPLADADPRYVANHFGRSLRYFLRGTLQDFDGQRVTDYLVITTCQKLLTFLIVQGRQQPVFRRFWQLLQGVGYTLTVGLLLRIVLFCSAVKPWMENRLTVLFNYHERYVCKEVPWLINTLEHTNVALITNFGKFGYSFT